MVNFLPGITAIWFLLVLVQFVPIFDAGSASCGKRPLFPKSQSYRIIGGRKTVVGEVPWQVSIRYSVDNGYNLCSGSIIGEKWILTAAHCIEDKKDMTLDVVSGLVNLDNDKKGTLKRKAHMQVHRVKRIVSRGFDFYSWDNDIALLELATPLRFDDFTQSVCLPRATDNFIRLVCNVSGWGVTDEATGTYSRILKTVALPVIPLTYCNKLYTRQYSDYTISDNFMCTLFAQGGRDACDGDSGGPLVCVTQDGLFRQAGVTSWGEECGGSRSPGVYTDVAKHLQWIHEVTGLDIE